MKTISAITDEYLLEVCRVISRGFSKNAFPMLDGAQVSWPVWLRHALDLDRIDTLEARVAKLEACGWEAMAHLSPEGCKAANAAALATKEKNQ